MGDRDRVSSGEHGRMTVTVVRYSERPELWDQITGLSAEVWPEYNMHGDVLNAYWSQLYEQFPGYQFVLYDENTGDVLAEGQTIPRRWDGRTDTLGPGIDDVLVNGFALKGAGGRPDTLCALAAEIPPRNQARRLSKVVLSGMADIAREAGLHHLVAPVRPNWKD